MPFAPAIISNADNPKPVKVLSGLSLLGHDFSSLASPTPRNNAFHKDIYFLYDVNFRAYEDYFQLFFLYQMSDCKSILITAVEYT